MVTAILLSPGFFSLSLPRGLLLLLGITSNKNEQAVKPNDLDGITSNLLQTADVQDPGQTVARSLLQSQEGQRDFHTHIVKEDDCRCDFSTF